MRVVSYYCLDESMSNPGKYIIRLNLDKLPTVFSNGSYNLLAARLLGLSYADYLRMCRDCFGAEIQGKNSMYPLAFFSADKKPWKLVQVLNERLSAFAYERENSNWRNDPTYITKKEEMDRRLIDAFNS